MSCLILPEFILKLFFFSKQKLKPLREASLEGKKSFVMNCEARSHLRFIMHELENYCPLYLRVNLSFDETGATNASYVFNLTSLYIHSIRQKYASLFATSFFQLFVVHSSGKPPSQSEIHSR